ncbi:MAG: hypothetical protein C4525_03255 [Desulfarculus sp.]|jgi:hypothetical protein|nr:MAG: hypothetical protein C4525_03255 [Desulfarculus sp.]
MPSNDNIRYESQSLPAHAIALAYRDGQSIGSYRARLLLKEDGRILLEPEGDPLWHDDGTRMDIWHRQTLHWGIPCDAAADDLEELLADPESELHRLLARIHAGHTVEWDGSNHRGRVSEDAQEAADELGYWLESDYPRYEGMPVGDAHYWISADGNRSALDILTDLLERERAAITEETLPAQDALAALIREYAEGEAILWDIEEAAAQILSEAREQIEAREEE